MTLLSPWGLAAAALLPVVVLLYLLRGLRQHRIVPSIQLWEGEAGDVTSHKRWRRPPLELVLFLQLLFVLSGALALARPALQGQPQRHLIVVLDASASMQALDGDSSTTGPRATRLDDARRMVMQLVDQSARSEVTLVRAGPIPSVVFEGDDVQNLRRVLASIAPSGMPTDMQAAVDVAASLAAQQAQAANEIVVVSDGAYPPIADRGGLSMPVRFLLVGRSTNNQAVTSLIARRSSSASNMLEGFARVVNTAGQSVEVPVRATADGTPLEVRQVHLDARSQVELIFHLPPGTTRLGVSLETNDMLPLDDAAEATVEAGIRMNVLLVSAQPTPLADAVRSVPNAELSIQPPNDYDPGTADLVVFDSFLPQNLPARPLVVVHPPPGSALVAVGGEVSDLDAKGVDRTSPLLTGVDVAALHFSGAGILQPTPWGATILSSGSTPLILQGQVEGRRIVVLGFDPVLSGLTDTAAFPLLVANAVNWATTALDSVPEDADEMRPPRDQVVDIAPRAHTELAVAGSSVPVEGAPRELWPWVVVIAAGVCGAEWWYYSRHG